VNFWVIRASVAAALGFFGCAQRSDLEEAQRAIERGEWQDAYRSISRAAEKTPDSADVQRALARICLHTMRTSQGGRAAARAVELSREDADAHFLKSLLDARRFRIQSARAAIDKALAINPQEARYHIARGEFLLSGGTAGSADWTAAAQAFREAQRLKAGDDRARFGLGKALVLGGEHQEGEKELDEFLASSRAVGEAHYLRGLARLRRRDFPGAEEDFRRATLLAPELPATYFNLCRVLRMTGRLEEEEATRQQYEIVQKHFEQTNGAKLTFHLESTNVPLGMELAGLLAPTSESDDAVTLLQSLCLDFGEPPIPLLKLGEIALATRKLGTASAALSRVRQLAPMNAEAWNLSALVELERSAPEAALPFAREAVRLAPADASFRMTLGQALLDTKSWGEAKSVFEVAVRSASDQQARASGGLGLAELGLGNAEAAERALTAGLEKRPRRHDWMCARGKARLALGHIGAARDDFRRAIELAPHYAPSYEGLASALRSTNAAAEADSIEAKFRELESMGSTLRQLETRLWERPNDAVTARQLAATLEEMGRSAEAAKLRSSYDRFGVEP
jgi:tetratricopeptide (TPR) repeat protein